MRTISLLWEQKWRGLGGGDVSFFFFSFRLRASWHRTWNTADSEYPPLHLCERECQTFPQRPCSRFEVLTPEAGCHVLTTQSFLSRTCRLLFHSADLRPDLLFSASRETNSRCFMHFECAEGFNSSSPARWAAVSVLKVTMLPWTG